MREVAGFDGFHAQGQSILHLLEACPAPLYCIPGAADQTEAANAPEQDEPQPAVQPKQCSPVMIRR